VKRLCRIAANFESETEVIIHTKTLLLYFDKLLYYMKEWDWIYTFFHSFAIALFTMLTIMKNHFHKIGRNRYRSTMRFNVFAFAALLLFMIPRGGTAAPIPGADAKFEGAVRGILAVYDTKGEAAALRRATLFGVRIRKRGGEQNIPLILTPRAGLSAAGMSTAWLETRGITVEARSKSWLRVIVPLRLVRVIAEDPQVTRIELPLRPVPFDCAYGMGSIVSQGVALTYADSFQAHNFTGSGIKIAVVDEGFINIESAIANGELPASTVKIKLPGSEEDSISTVTDHGTAVAEHIMDMAPGATLYCIQVADQLDMENTRDTLKADGIRIANHSVGWFVASYYNDSGPINQIIDSSHDVDSVFWAVAAGNEAQSHWRGTWLNTSSTDATILNFSSAPVDSFLTLTDENNSETVSLFLNWNQYSSTQGPATDLYLYVYGKNGALVASSTDSGEPYQALSFTYNSSNGPYSVKVKKHSGPTDTLNITLFAAPGTATLTYHSSGAFAGPGCSLADPADAHGAFAAGAVSQAYYDSAIYNGANPPPIEYFSSRGPTNDGREKPDIAATDSTSCYTYGATPALGTSFSSPTVAGAAALILQRYAPLSIVQLADTLRAWAKDAPAGGWDSAYGAGLLSLKYPSSPPTLVSPANNTTGIPLPVELSLSWSTLTGATSYHLQVSTTTSFSTTIIDEPGLTGSQSTFSATLAGTYNWRVEGVFTACCTGPWSNAWNFTTLPPAVALVSPTNGATNQLTSLTLSWGTATGATSYNVQVSALSTFTSTIVSQTGVAGLSASISGLANNTPYYWKVSATNAGGTGGWSNVWSFTTIAIPGAPSLISPTNNATNQSTSPTLSWGTVTGAATYHVLVSTSSTFTSTVSSQTNLTGLSASVTGLANSTPYYWEANATNAGGTGIWSSVWSFTTIAIPGMPSLASPTNGAANQSTSPTLSWGTATGAATYNVLVSTSTSFATTVSNQTGLTGLSTLLTGLANSTPYYWKVSATNTGGTGAWSGMWSFTTIIATPIAPTLALPSNNATNQLTSPTLSWSTVAGATTYNVLVSSASNFSSTVSSQSGVAGLSVTVSGLANGASYYWEVSATNTGGTSAWSGVWSFTTIIATPIAPTLAAPTNNAVNQPTSPTLNWSTVAGAATYNILVSTSTSFTTTVSSQIGVAGLSASVSGLANGTSYYWEVSATNAGGTSAWSSVWSFTTIIATPIAPTLALPSNNATNQSTSPTLSWGTATGAATYNILVSSVLNFGSTVASQIGVAGLSATVSGLANGTSYYWEVSATNAGGTSAWSGVWSFTTIIATPIAPTLALPLNNATNQLTSPTLSWSTVAGAATYNVLVSSVSNFSSTVTSQRGVAGLSATVSGLANGASYYWEVSATNAGGTSAWSSAWSFSTGVRLVIPLAKGWNMKSLNIHPADSTTGGVFNGLKGLYLVEDGKGDLYWPGYGIDQIDTIRTGSGYQIYDTVSTDTIRLTGNPVAVDSTPISLKALNWSIIAYLPQVNRPIATALAGIASQVEIAEDNEGNLYWPGYDIDQIDTMRVGEGYFIVTSAAATLTYSTGVAKQVAGGKALLNLPAPRHYAKHRITGNDALFLARHIEVAGSAAPDNCEVGAFDSQGNLVGAGTVVNGLTAFAIWGKDPMTTAKDGCDPSEKIAFRLWDGQREHPLEVTGGGDPTYEANKVLIATLAVPAQALISSFDLPLVYPNPFRGSVRIAFDVPALQSAADQEVEIGVYDMKGSLVQSLVKGRYAAGSYTVSWNGKPAGSLASGSGIYFVRMKADGFDKRLKLIEVR
jgi:hypothetical protein